MSLLVGEDEESKEGTAVTAHKPLITVKEWHSIAVWNWDAPAEQCAICKNALSDVCVDCHVRGVHREDEQLPTLHELAARFEPEATTSPRISAQEKGQTVQTHNNTIQSTTQQRNDNNEEEGNPACTTSNSSSSSSSSHTSEDAFASRHSSPTPEATQSASHQQPLTATTSEQPQQQQHVSSSSSRPSQSLRLSRAIQSVQSGCAIAWGSCGHVFHNHCIVRWLQHRQICPNCGEAWKLYKLTSNE